MIENAIVALLRWYRYARTLVRLRSAYWARRALDYHLQFDKLSVRNGGRELYIGDLDAAAFRGRSSPLIAGYARAKTLKKLTSCRFETQGEKLYAEIGGIRLGVETVDELFILNEVFVDGVYDFLPTRKSVVWDIGMNVGYASLRFASLACVEKVVGFEPFKNTYSLALSNFSYNSHLSGKILPFNFGIGGRNKTVLTDYCAEHRGKVGIHRLAPAYRKNVEVRAEEIELRDAVEVLDWIRSEHPGLGLVVKMDCEGSEYEIVRSLDASGGLGLIDVLMAEWHRPGTPTEITERLRRHGFSVLTLQPQSLTCGMIYAVRGRSDMDVGKAALPCV